MKMEQTECSETSVYELQTPGNYPEESIQHSERGESFEILNFLDRFMKNLQISNVMKIRPVVAELFHAYGQMDRHGEANGHFSKFCERG
jgi:hypothetical protein